MKRAKVLREKRHTIRGTLVSVRPISCVPEDSVDSVDDRSVLVKGIPPGTSRETVSHFLEKLAGPDLTVVGAHTGIDPTSSVLTFDGEISDSVFTSMTQNISKESFLGTFLTVEQVQKPNAVLVKGIKDEQYFKEKLEYYFESKKSRGGSVKDVVILRNRKAAVVTFQEADVAKRVSENSHTLEGLQLHVSVYYREIGYEEDDDEEDTGDSWTMEFPCDPHIVSFLSERPAQKRRLAGNLKPIHGSLPQSWIDVTTNQIRVVADESKRMDRKEKWEKKCAEVVQEFLDGFTTKLVHFPDYVWSRIEEECEVHTIYYQELIDVQVAPASHNVRVTGVEDECQKILKGFARIQREENKKSKEEEKETTKVLTDKNKAKLALIERKGVAGVPPGVVVMIRSNEGKIEFKGKATLVERAVTKFLEVLTSIMENSIRVTDKHFVRILASKEGEEKVRCVLKKAGLDVVHEVTGKGSECTMRFYSFYAEATEKAAEVIQGSLTTQSIPVQKAKLSYLHTDPWEALQEKLVKDLCVWMEVTDLRDTKTVVVYGFSDDVKEAAKQITHHLGQKPVASETMSILPGQAEYIIKFKVSEIKKLEKDKRVQIIINGDNGELIIQGPTDKIHEAESSLKAFVDKIKNKQVAIKQPGMVSSMQSGPGRILLGDLEKKNNVYIAIKAAAKPSVSTTAMLTAASPMSTGSFTTPEGINITLVEGNIEQETADVIVNSIKFDMDLSAGNVSAAIAHVAGPQLQQECTKIGKMSAGEMKKTGGFNLQCKEIYHVVCPDWEPGKEQVLSSLMSQCLAQAHQDGVSSIAFPTIGTGNLKFPKEAVADVMFKEAVQFSANNSQTKVKDIRFVLYPQDAQSITSFKMKLLEVQGRPKTVRMRRRVSKPNTPGLTLKSISATCTETDHHGVTIQVQQGDLTKDKVDVIVNTSDDKLNFGKLGDHIVQQGGQSIKDECDQHAGNVQKGQIIVTGAGKLPFKKVYHMILTHKNLIHQSVEKCCELAEKFRCSSISFPAIGTGNANVPVAESAKETIDGILGFVEKTKPRHLRCIRVTIFDQRQVGQYHSELRCRGTAPVTGTAAGITIKSEKPNFIELSCNAVTVQVKQGNVMDDTVDIIVNTVDSGL
ncbi:uncharacterized protein LOC106173081, partial [Lingula anatina]|uniref:Uncharacterized protein LOC106173081 n=1 Tax=Lingula anatina TaxID=7574 RepID=A0A1S3JHA5_LINAN